jgi:hypothetical protein
VALMRSSLGPESPGKVKLEVMCELPLPVLQNPSLAGQSYWTAFQLHGYLKAQLAMDLVYRTSARPSINSIFLFG